MRAACVGLTYAWRSAGPDVDCSCSSPATLASATIGVLSGLTGSLLVARWMSDALDTSAMDVSAFVWAVGVLMGVAAVAAIVPAHRAVSIDPSTTLRAV